MITTRLEWDGRKGTDMCDGVVMELRNPPCGALAEVHYTPGMQAEVRERDCDAKLEMTAQEISAADRWLAVMAMLAREAVGQTEGGH